MTVSYNNLQAEESQEQGKKGAADKTENISNKYNLFTEVKQKKLFFTVNRQIGFGPLAKRNCQRTKTSKVSEKVRHKNV